MKWFTREWQRGQLPDGEADSLDDRYRQHVGAITPGLPPHILEFALPEQPALAVDDAKVDRIEVDPTKRVIHMRLLNGDLQAGYGKLDLRFSEADLIDPSISELADWVNDPRTEFLRQEVDRTSAGAYEARFLLWPEGEILIHCGDFETAWTPIDDDSRRDYLHELVVKE